jgi:hypothetical protein
MATTAGGTPYVESSDLVADYPTVSLALAEHIDDLPAAVLQVVRATDTTTRTTTSTTFVDVTGMSITITPQKSTSAVIIISTGWARAQSSIDGANYIRFQISDSSNNPVAGAEDVLSGVQNLTGTGTREAHASLILWAYSTPATTSPITYKLRFRTDNASVTAGLINSNATGQMYAIEVSA